MEPDSEQKAEASFLLRAGNLAAGTFNANVSLLQHVSCCASVVWVRCYVFENMGRVLVLESALQNSFSRARPLSHKLRNFECVFVFVLRLCFGLDILCFIVQW